VVLIDEIDKADPDLPNGLLVPLGSSEFLVEETGVLVTEKAPSEVPDGPASAMLVLITTNEERDLPRAFLRRCVTTELKQPGKKRLVEIGRRHLTAQSVDCDADTVSLLESVADKIIELRKAGRGRSQRPPSTAEYLDAVFACRALDVRVAKTGVWPTLERLILVKGAESTDGA
jgi:MoxR-like ATPase